VRSNSSENESQHRTDDTITLPYPAIVLILSNSNDLEIIDVRSLFEGAQQGGGLRQFHGPDVEQDFRLFERTARVPMVRLYGLITLAQFLCYALLNPVFFDSDDAISISAVLMASLIVLGIYVAFTFWDRYAELPAIDFTALLALGLLILVTNLLLWHGTATGGGPRYANVAINNAVVCAFAAIVLSDRFHWFLAWIACHAAAFSLVLFFFEGTAEGRTYAALSYVTGAAISLFINWSLGQSQRAAYSMRSALEAERRKTEELLYNVLPEAAARRLKDGHVVADAYSDASVVFADLVGFSRLAKTVSPGHLVQLLNEFFNMADRCAAEHGVEKVKTIGDAYLAISGGNVASTNSADAALAFAQALIEGMEDVRESTGLSIAVRVGIHSGPVVGGVIGATRMAYDYWGETMNMASRIEPHAEPDSIAVSESTYLRCRHKALFSPPEQVQLKGVGETTIYRLCARTVALIAVQ
jgi:class 3 adenylate cyclase